MNCGLRIEDRSAAGRPLRSVASGRRGPVVQTNPIPGDGGWGEAIPRSLPEMAFLREKPRIPFRARVVFWCSGILGWRPQKRGFGAPAPCVFGTWHVAVWILGAKTRGNRGRPLVLTPDPCPLDNRVKQSQPRLCRAGRGLGGRGTWGKMRKTNPISEGVSSAKFQVLSRRSRAARPRRPLTSNFTLRTSGGTPTARRCGRVFACPGGWGPT